MPTSVDQLYIDINANAVKANDAIDRLVAKLDRLSASLSRVDGSKITGVANGVQKLGNAMQIMNNIKTADFTRLANNLAKLGSINTAGLNSSASALNQITRAFNNLGAVSKSAEQVGVLAGNLAKLGYKSVDKAITNVPKLAQSLRNLMVTLSQSPRVSKNVIQMTNALANLASQGRNVGTATTALTTGLTRTGTIMRTTRGRTLSLAAAFGKFYASYFLVIRGIKAFWNAIKSTADYIEAFNYQTVAIQKIASEWDKDYAKYGYQNAEAYSESFQKRLNESLSKLSGIQINMGKGLLEESGLKNLGLSIKEITQYASQLASVTNSVGQTGETSIAIATSFTKLAGDISSLFNVDYSSVAQNLQSGLIGQSRALYKYGIDITNATLQTYAYQLGLSKAVSEMTQMEKMQLRTIAILDQSKVSWGDLANTIQSPSNMVRQFKNNLSELGIMLGQLFIPVLQKVLPYINGFTIALKRLMVSIANTLGIKLDLSSFGQGYTEMEEGIDDVTDAYEEATKAANKFKSATIGIDKLNIISPPEDNKGSSAGSSAVPSIDLTDEIKKATEEYEKIWNKAYEKMQSKAQLVADNITKALEPIKTIINDFAVGDFFKAGQDVSSLVTSINLFLAKAIQSVDWEKVGNDIGLFLKGLDWTAILSSVGMLFWQALNAAIDLWKGSFKVAPIETALITAFALLNFTGLGKLIMAKMGLALLSGFKKIKLGEMLTAFIAGVKGLFGSKAAVSALAFMNKLAVAITGIGSIVTGAFLAIFNFVKMITDGFSWLNEILMVIGVGLAAVGAAIVSGHALVVGVVAAIIAAIGTAVVLIKDNWESIKSTFVNAGTWFVDNVGKPVASVFVKIKDNIVKVFQGAWIITKAVWIAVATFFKNYVVEPILKIFAPIGKKIGEQFTKTLSTIKNAWGKVSEWFGTNIGEPLKSVFVDVCETIGNLFKDLWNNGIKQGLVSGLNFVVTVIESGINRMIDGINVLIKAFNLVVKGASKVTGDNWGGIDLIPSVSLPRIPAYSTGGFPEDGLFYANHNELVGQFANGKTAVSNNKQIISGIERGVENAMMRVFANGGFGGGETTIHNHIALDGREVAQNTNKFNSTRGKQIFGNQTNYNFA